MGNYLNTLLNNNTDNNNINILNKDEYKYLYLLQKILDKGQLVDNDRTNVGTYSLFAQKLSFDLQNNTLPLLTTKRIFLRGVIEELLFFLKGLTNVKYLQEKNIHIWDAHSNREYLDSIGLTDYPEGEIGPMYGYQWRHFNSEEYLIQKTKNNVNTIDNNQNKLEYDKDLLQNKKLLKDEFNIKTNIDQLAEVIKAIKENPSSRRHIVTAWNPSQLHAMALPPCHIMFQFYVNQANKTLECSMYQRSADAFLGLPFNIASYAMLTHIIAVICGLTAKKLTIFLGDVHIYKNHVKQCKEQINRAPLMTPFPTLIIKSIYEDPANYIYEDFEILNYTPLNIIKAPIAI